MANTRTLNWQSSSIAEILDDIGDKYLLRPFATTTKTNGLLNYDAIRKNPINYTTLARPIHGKQNAARTAALIPIFYQFFHQHRDALLPDLKEQLLSLNAEKIKKIQIVALMRATGRTQDGDSGRLFAEQGEKECLAYLEQLEIDDQTERKSLAYLIVSSEGGKSICISSILLGAACLAETFRDGNKFENKNVFINRFFSDSINYPFNLYTVNEFLTLFAAHSKVIKAHQGFIFSGLKLDEKTLAHPDSVIDPYSIIIQYSEKMKNLEFDKNCYLSCEQDIIKIVSPILDTDPRTMYSNIPHLFKLLEPFKTNTKTNNVHDFVIALRKTFEKDIENKKLVGVGNFICELDWMIILYNLPAIFEYSFPELQPIKLENLFIRNAHETEYDFICRMIEKLFSKNLPYFIEKNNRVEIFKWELLLKHLEEKCPHLNKTLGKIYTDKVLSNAFVEERNNKLIVNYKVANDATTADYYLRFFSMILGIEYKGKEWDHGMALDLDLDFANKCLAFHREKINDIGNQYIIKSFRSRDNDTTEFGLDSILPKKMIPIPQDMRPKSKNKYTVYANGKVEKRKNKPPMYSPQQKEDYSSIQSVTLLNKTATTKYADLNSVIDSPRVGVMIPTADILPNRLLTYRAMWGTVSRPFDANTEANAKNIFQNNKYKSTPSKSFFGHTQAEWDAFVTAINNDGNNENEVLARLKWGLHAKVIILADNLQSRLYAQELAYKIKKRLQKISNPKLAANLIDNEVPILFYLPGHTYLHLAYYSQYMQKEDIKNARAHHHNAQKLVPHPPWEVFLSLTPNEIFELHNSSQPPNHPFRDMLIKNYFVLVDSLISRCTSRQQKLIIEKILQCPDIDKKLFFKMLQKGCTTLAKKFINLAPWHNSQRGWDFDTDYALWWPCFEESIHAKVIEIIGYQQTLKMLAKHNHWHKIIRILEKFTSQEQYKQKDQFSELLDSAIKTKQKKVVKLLLKNGIFSSSALHEAIAQANIDLIKLLIEKAVNPNILIDGKTAFDLVLEKGNRDIIKLFLDLKELPYLTINPNTLKINLDKETINVIQNIYYASKEFILLGQQRKYNSKTGELLPEGAAYYGNALINVLATVSRHVIDQYHLVATLIEKGAALHVTSQWYWNWTALHFATRNGHLDYVQLLVKHKANVNANDAIGRSYNDNEEKYKITPLFMTLENTPNEVFIPIINCLIDNGADVNLCGIDKQNNKFSLLYYATTLGNISVIKLLLEKGAKLNTSSLHPIHEVITSPKFTTFDKTELIELFIKYDPSCLSFKDAQGYTPLMLAAKCNASVDVIKCLLNNDTTEKQSTIQIMHSYSGETAFDLALGSGNKETIRLFLQLKEIPYLTIDPGSLNLSLNEQENIQLKDLYFISKQLTAKKNDVKPEFFKGILYQDSNTIFYGEILIQCCRFVSKKTLDQYNLISYIIETGTNASLAFAKTHGFTFDDPESQIISRFSKEHGYAGYWAVYYGYLEYTKFFIEKGMHFFNPYKERTPLLAVLANTSINPDDQFDIIHYLLELKLHIGISINAPNSWEKSEYYGQTPLYIATVRNNKRIVAELLAHGAKQTVGKYYPIFAAIANNNLELVKLLVNAEPTCVNQISDDDNPLIKAVRENKREIVEYLLEKNCNINERMKGKTAFDYAVLAGNHPIINLFLQLKKLPYLTIDPSDLHTSATTKYKLQDIFFVTTILLDLNEKNSQPTSKETDEIKLGKALIQFCRGVSREVLYQYDLIPYLINKGANVNYQDEEFGWTALHYAAQSGCLEMVKLLIKNEAKLNILAQDGSTPLHFAAQSGCLEVVELLIQKGAQVNTSSNDGSTPLLEAVINNQSRTVAYLLKQDANVNVYINEKNNPYYQQTPLYIATVNNNIDLVKKLLQRGASPHLRGLSCYPIFAAITNNNLELVELLLKADSSCLNLTLNNLSPLRAAIKAKNTEIVTYLLKVTVEDVNKIIDGKTAFDLALETGNNDIINLFLQLKKLPYLTIDLSDLHTSATTKYKLQDIFFVTKTLLDLSEKNSHGSKPEEAYQIKLGRALIHFCRNVSSEVLYQYDLIPYLINKGANVNYQDNESGWTALHYAAQSGCLKVVELLIQKGAPVNTSSNDGSTPLLEAVINNQSHTVAYLLKQDANVNVYINEKNNPYYQQTPLYIATVHNDIDLVNKLLQHGASPHLRGSSCYPIFAAIANNNLELVELLLKADSSCLSLTSNNLSPLRAAIKAKNTKIVTYLLKVTVEDVNKIIDGKTAFDLALETGNNDIINLFLQLKKFPHLTIDPSTLDLKNLSKVTKDILQGHFLAFKAMLFLDDIESERSLPKKDAFVELFEIVSKEILDQYNLVNFSIRRTDINEKNNLGQTALHWAIRHKYEDYVNMLVENEADVNSTCSFMISSALRLNVTPLLIACSRNQTKIAELLIAKGAKVNIYATDEQGNTFSPLFFAILSGNVELAFYLLENGAKSYHTLKEKDKHSPIHLIIKSPRLKDEEKLNLINKLIEVDSDCLKTRDGMNLTVFDLAIEEGNEKIIQIFLQNKILPYLSNLPPQNLINKNLYQKLKVMYEISTHLSKNKEQNVQYYSDLVKAIWQMEENQFFKNLTPLQKNLFFAYPHPLRISTTLCFNKEAGYEITRKDYDILFNNLEEVEHGNYLCIGKVLLHLQNLKQKDMDECLKALRNNVKNIKNIMRAFDFLQSENLLQLPKVAMFIIAHAPYAEFCAREILSRINGCEKIKKSLLSDQSKKVAIEIVLKEIAHVLIAHVLRDSHYKKSINFFPPHTNENTISPCTSPAPNIYKAT